MIILNAHQKNFHSYGRIFVFTLYGIMTWNLCEKSLQVFSNRRRYYLHMVKWCISLLNFQTLTIFFFVCSVIPAYGVKWTIIWWSDWNGNSVIYIGNWIKNNIPNKHFNCETSLVFGDLLSIQSKIYCQFIKTLKPTMTTNTTVSSTSVFFCDFVEVS